MTVSADTALNALSAAEVAAGVAAGELAPEAVAEACLARIAAREPEVHAWAHCEPEAALARARAAPDGPLRGVPVGIKDVLDTYDMPTGMGSPIYAGHRPAADASCVAILRAAGAVILGKTVACEFAGMMPSETRNPLDPARTPGGSSSGSAAAVADLMVPVALGTQTGGSILRPSSFCGIVGFKPSYGVIDRAGLKLAAQSFDTIGIHARSVDDAALVFDALTGAAPAKPPPEPQAPRIGLCRTFLWADAAPETVEAVEDAAGRLDAAGAEVGEVELGEDFAALMEAREVINAYERARALAHEWHHHRAGISGTLAATLEDGFATPFAAYREALALAARLRAAIAGVIGPYEALLAPCVPGEAPAGLDSTGDPRMQGLWTALHVPTVSLPTHHGPRGLPVGIQLVGRPLADKALLGLARWAARVFDLP